MTHDDVVIAFGGSLVAAMGAVIVYFANRRSNQIRSLLLPVVTGAGWTTLRSRVSVAPGVRGVWRSFPAKIVYFARQKSTPARLVLTVRAPGASRLIVQRRTKFLFGNRPLTWFGPPLVDVHHPAGHDLWIRSDEPAFAERVFGDEKLAATILLALTGAFDEVRIGRRHVKITRALPYATNAFRLDTAVIERAARDEVAIAEALIGKFA